MISPEQKEKRRKYIGSSDAAAVIGIDPYRSPADVFLEKTGMLAEWDGNTATDAGTRLERTVLEWAADELGLLNMTGTWFEQGIACANLDALIIGKPEIVEAKTTGIVGPRDEAFGEPGTDELPDRIIIQVHHQMAVCGPEYRVTWVPVLIGGVGFRMYRVDRNDDLAVAIANQERYFWHEHVLKGVPPSDSVPSLEVLKRIKRTPETFATVPDELMDRLDMLKLVASGAEKSAKEIHAAVLATMQPINADGIRTPSGRTFGYLEQSRKGFTVEPTSFRLLREIKDKKSK